MSIDLTNEQRQAVMDGEAVHIALEEGGQPIVLLREDLYKLLEEDRADRQVQTAFLRASHEAAVAWMKDNPF